MTQKKVTRALGKVYTAFIVRDSNSRRFLNRKVYTGRARGIWSKLAEAQIFYTAAQAQSCASNINARRPEGYSAFQAEVVPVKMRGRGKRLS